MKAKVMVEGTPALENFLHAMKDIFRAPKQAVKIEKPKRKKSKKPKKQS